MNIHKEHLKSSAKIFIVAVFILGAYLGGSYLNCKMTLKRGQDFFQKQLWGLAAHEFDKIIDDFSPDTKNCPLIVTTYYLTAQPLKLEYSSQLCVYAGVITPEVILAGASAFVLRQQYDLALKHLVDYEKNLEGSIQYYFELAGILEKLNKKTDALLVMLDASRKFLSDESKIVKIFNWIYQRKKFKAVLGLARKLHLFSIPNATLNFQLADVFFSNSEDELGIKAVENAFIALNDLPQKQQININRNFSHIIRQRDEILKTRTKK